MVDGADLVRFIQHGVVENRICACAPSQRGCVGMVFEAKESLGGTPAARRRLAGSFAQFFQVDFGKQQEPGPIAWPGRPSCLPQVVQLLQLPTRVKQPSCPT